MFKGGVRNNSNHHGMFPQHFKIAKFFISFQVKQPDTFSRLTPIISITFCKNDITKIAFGGL